MYSGKVSSPCSSYDEVYDDDSVSTYAENQNNNLVASTHSIYAIQSATNTEKGIK